MKNHKAYEEGMDKGYREGMDKTYKNMGKKEHEAYMKWCAKKKALKKRTK